MSPHSASGSSVTIPVRPCSTQPRTSSRPVRRNASPTWIKRSAFEAAVRPVLVRLVAAALALGAALPAAAGIMASVEVMSKAAASMYTDTVGGLVNPPKAMSSDGRYVVFTSDAANLIDGMVLDNSEGNVFLYDRVAGTLTLVSHRAGSATTTGNGWGASDPSISADGAWVAFDSDATNLIGGQTDGNDSTDVFLFERATGNITLVSHAPGAATTAGNNYSYSPVISADGGWVVFESDATNLVTGQTDTNDTTDLFLFERATGTVTIVSHIAGAATTTSNSGAGYPVISGDGARVAFVSNSTDLVSGQSDGNGGSDVFLFETSTGAVTLVSHTPGSATTTGNGTSSLADISTDGAWVVFSSYASNLVSGATDNNGQQDVLLYQCAGGAISLVSHAAGSPSAVANNLSWKGVINSDGTWVAFISSATDLVSGQTDGNTAFDAFLYDRVGDTSAIVSHSSAGVTTTANNYSDTVAISSDGAWVAFESLGTDLVASQTDTNSDRDVFLYQRGAGTVTLVSHSAGVATQAGNGRSTDTAISGDGAWVVLDSPATDLVSGVADVPASVDVFLYGRSGDTMTLVTRRATSMPSLTGNGDSDTYSYSAAVISADGAWAVFTSKATNLVAGQVDGNNDLDAFLCERASGKETLVSHIPGSATTAGNGLVGNPAISADGAWIAFQSAATNLVSGQVDTNGAWDIFLYERATGTVTLVSHVSGSATTAGSQQSYNPVISADGAWVAFASDATNLVSGEDDTNLSSDVFLYERATGMITLVSHAFGSFTTAGQQGAVKPFISADGGWVVFASHARNLVSDQAGLSTWNIFLFERATGAISLVSHVPDSPVTNANKDSGDAAISGDGARVAFASAATDLVTGESDSNGDDDIFVYERSSGSVTLVSHGAGTPTTTANAGSYYPILSADGAWVAYTGSATNLVVGQVDGNGEADVFLYDIAHDTATLVSRVPGSPTTAGNGMSYDPTLSADASLVGFSSTATDLVGGQVDTNGTYVEDVFLFRRAGGSTGLVSQRLGTTTTTGNFYSSSPVINANGSFLVFAGVASDLVAGDYNLKEDAFLYTADADGDGVPDGIDNCPAVANPSQADMDGDGIGDACDDDMDGDGVSNAIEDAGPNGGDGNGDGTPDSQQHGVTSLPAAVGGGYLTVGSSCPLTNVLAMTESAPLDPLYEYPFGLVSFVAHCESADITIFVHGASSLAGFDYCKFGPTTPGQPATTAWYEQAGVTLGTATVGSATVATASFTLLDNAQGDDTGDDGDIVDQGGPGFAAQQNEAIPLLDPRLGLALAALIALAGALALRRAG